MEEALKVTVMNGQRVKTFGAALVRARQAVGLTQSQLSAAAGVPQSSLSVWERGEAEPSPETVFALEGALAVDDGALSRLLGFAPVGKELAVSTEAAIWVDPRFDKHQRKLLLQIVQAMVSGE